MPAGADYESSEANALNEIDFDDGLFLTRLETLWCIAHLHVQRTKRICIVTQVGMRRKLLLRPGRRLSTSTSRLRWNERPTRRSSWRKDKLISAMIRCLHLRHQPLH